MNNINRSAAYVHHNDRTIVFGKETFLKLLRAVLLALVLVLVLSNRQVLTDNINNLSNSIYPADQSKSVKCNPSRQELEQGLLPMKISVPKHDIATTVERVHYQNGSWKLIPGVANYAIGTSMISMKRGNTGIYGQSSMDFFKRLMELEKADRLEITAHNTQSGKRYLLSYEVVSSSKVEKSGQELFYPTETALLTILINGNDFNDIEYVITAKPVLIRALECES